ncbi:hypothetical protein [Mycobacterium avium]|nr:hypothetical protein [Mycobacterium avium]
MDQVEATSTRRKGLWTTLAPLTVVIASVVHSPLRRVEVAST